MVDSKTLGCRRRRRHGTCDFRRRRNAPTEGGEGAVNLDSASAPGCRRRRRMANATSAVAIMAVRVRLRLALMPTLPTLLLKHHPPPPPKSGPAAGLNQLRKRLALWS